MRSEAPPLLPILRSRAQGELLGALLLDPEHEWTLSELSRRLDIPLTSTQSEIARLSAGGLLRTRKAGRTRLVRPDLANPVLAPLTQLIMLTFGPGAVIPEEFARLGADHVIVFGSWAARLSGQPGPAPGDIDVLIVGDAINRDELYAAAERAEARLGRPVNPVIRDSHSWRHPEGDPLLEEILRRPFVDTTAIRP